MPENAREGNEGLEGGFGKTPEQIDQEHLAEFIRVTEQCFELEEKGVDIDTMGTLDRLIPGFKEGVKVAFSDWMMDGLKQKHGNLLGPKTEEQAIEEGYEPKQEYATEEQESSETIDETVLFSPTTVDAKGNIVDGYEYYDTTIPNYLNLLQQGTTNEVLVNRGEELNLALDQYIIDFSVFLFELIDTHPNIQEQLNSGDLESLEYFRLFINHTYVGKIHGTIDEKINFYTATRLFEGNFNIDSQEDSQRFKDVVNLNRKTNLLTIQESFYSEGFIDLKTQSVKIDGEQKQISIPIEQGQSLFMEEMLKYISNRSVTENRYYNSETEGEEITEEDKRIQEALNKGLYQMIVNEGYQILTIRKNAEIKYNLRLETNRDKYFEQGSHEGTSVTADNRNQVKEVEYTEYLKTAGSRLYEYQFLEATRSMLTGMEYKNINFGRLMKNTSEVQALIENGEVLNGEFASKVAGYVPLFIAGALEGVGDMAGFVFNSIQEGTNDIYDPNKDYETPPPINNVIRKSIIDITVVIGKEVGELVTDPLEAVPELIIGIDTILNDMEWGVIYDMVKHSFDTPHEAVYHTVQVIGLAYILLRVPSKINSLRQVYSAERIAMAEELITNVEFGKIVQRINTRPKKMPSGPTMKPVETTNTGVVAGALEGVSAVSKAVVEPIDKAYDSVKGVSRILNNLQKKFRTLEKFSQKTLTLEGAMGVSAISGNVIERGMEEGILSDSFIEQAGFTEEEKELYIDSYKPSESVMFQDQRDRAIEAMEESTEKIMGEYANLFDRTYEESIGNILSIYPDNIKNLLYKMLIKDLKEKPNF